MQIFPDFYPSPLSKLSAGSLALLAEAGGVVPVLVAGPAADSAVAVAVLAPDAAIPVHFRALPGATVAYAIGKNYLLEVDPTSARPAGEFRAGALLLTPRARLLTGGDGERHLAFDCDSAAIAEWAPPEGGVLFPRWHIAAVQTATNTAREIVRFG
ncbi:MAG TPA: hypothetical protein VEH84_19445 [Alphaproteobacteria bacterium]|nr:hypothetical protein [Alphaproteobacteria bacterium]